MTRLEPLSAGAALDAIAAAEARQESRLKEAMADELGISEPAGDYVTRGELLAAIETVSARYARGGPGVLGALADELRKKGGTK